MPLDSVQLVLTFKNLSHRILKNLKISKVPAPLESSGAQTTLAYDSLELPEVPMELQPLPYGQEGPPCSSAPQPPVSHTGHCRHVSASQCLTHRPVTPALLQVLTASGMFSVHGVTSSPSMSGTGCKPTAWV